MRRSKSVDTALEFGTMRAQSLQDLEEWVEAESTRRSLQVRLSSLRQRTGYERSASQERGVGARRTQMLLARENEVSSSQLAKLCSDAKTQMKFSRGCRQAAQLREAAISRSRSEAEAQRAMKKLKLDWAAAHYSNMKKMTDTIIRGQGEEARKLEYAAKMHRQRTREEQMALEKRVEAEFRKDDLQRRREMQQLEEGMRREKDRMQLSDRIVKHQKKIEEERQAKRFSSRAWKVQRDEDRHYKLMAAHLEIAHRRRSIPLPMPPTRPPTRSISPAAYTSLLGKSMARKLQHMEDSARSPPRFEHLSLQLATHRNPRLASSTPGTPSLSSSRMSSYSPVRNVPFR